MASVGVLTAAYGNFMVNPRPGAGVCNVCFNLTDGYSRCYACTRSEQWLDAFAPISYSVAHEQLHHVLASYKRLCGPVAARMRAELAAVLWRFLAAHERCVAAAAAAGESFVHVAPVPSGMPGRGADQPLHDVLGRVRPVSDRQHRLLERTDLAVKRRSFDSHRFRATRRLSGESVLLIDDTWTTGASAQSAAAALKSAGAGQVAAVVIGRHLNRPWGPNHRRLQALGPVFDWSRCALCRP